MAGHNHALGLQLTATGRFLVAFIVILSLPDSNLRAEETTARYFDQLRQRGLYSLAESEALSRLAADDLPLAAKTDYQIELSRSLAEHAGYVNDQQRDEFWKRSRTTLEEFLEHEPANPRAIFVEAQIAFAIGAEADWLRAERETRPFDEIMLERATEAATEAIGRLENLENGIKNPAGELESSHRRAKSVSGHDWRVLQHRIRWELALAYRNRSELMNESVDRVKAAEHADVLVRRLIGVADEPLQSRSRLLVVVCTRLKNQPDRAVELLNSLESNTPATAEAVLDEIKAERVRLLLELKRPTEAAELLLRIRSQRQRLTGELWYLQVKTLLMLRQIALEKKQPELANRLADQINTTVSRCEDQVGGYWSRRCQRIWENSQTAQKYGEKLDGLMQQARADFLAGRIEQSIAGYAASEKVAVSQGHRELAVELAFTRASILVEQKKFDTAASDLLVVVDQNLDSPLAPKSHLLAAYCLGRVFEADPSDPRREAYLNVLDQHIEKFGNHPTANDARFLKAQFEEQKSEWSQALALYLTVEPKHTRATEAMAGAARIYEMLICRPQQPPFPLPKLEKEAVDRLTRFLASEDNQVEHWNSARVDIALRLAAIILNASVEAVHSNEVDSTGKRPGLPGDFQNRAVQSEKAKEWLSRVLAWCDRNDIEGVTAEERDQLRQRAVSLQIFAFTYSGQYLDAERLLNSKMRSSADGLAIIDQLGQMVSASSGERRVRTAMLLSNAAEVYAAGNVSLSAPKQNRLDRSLAMGYLFSGRTKDAVDLASKVSNRDAKNIETQRGLAIQFGEINESIAIALAKQCWRKVEALTKPGSPDWLLARFNVINDCVRLQQFDEARKLMQITKVLYPDLGGATLKPQFQQLESDLTAK